MAIPGELFLNVQCQSLNEGCANDAIAPGGLDSQCAELYCKSADRLENLSHMIQAGVSLHLTIRVIEMRCSWQLISV